jgi:hypothetical protein
VGPAQQSAPASLPLGLATIRDYPSPLFLYTEQVVTPITGLDLRLAKSEWSEGSEKPVSDQKWWSAELVGRLPGTARRVPGEGVKATAPRQTRVSNSFFYGTVQA